MNAGLIAVVAMLAFTEGAAAAALEAAVPDYVLVASDGKRAGGPVEIDVTVLAAAGGRAEGPRPPGVPATADGHLAVAANAASKFRIWGPLGGSPCGVMARTSATAAGNKCRYATNAGPFDMGNGDCDAGVFIVGGKVEGTGGWDLPMFGVTQSGDWVLGRLNRSSAAAINVTYAVSGFYWLVRDGANVAGNSTYRAPRTAVGTDGEGRLVLLEVDGCEPQKGCKYALGKTDTEMAELLMKHGVTHAINLDGGGSSTVVQNGKVINRPTDTDLWSIESERAITTITCIE